MSPFYDLYLILAITVLLLLRAIWERLRHARHLKAVPIRIHVNGSRGKSCVVRLIAAGLRASGWRVVAKTTGTSPRLILPDGREEVIRRIGPASIREQIKLLRRAAKEGAQALVVEAMAIRPGLQAISEEAIIRSGIGIITNVRDDHTEEMGGSLEMVARAMSSTIPAGGVLFTAEEEYLHLIEEEARLRHTQVRPLAADENEPQALRPFPLPFFEENIRMAFKVCSLLGADADLAIAGMLQSDPDPGALRIHRLRRNGQEITFVNAFSANDPASALKIMDRLRDLGLLHPPIVAVVNGRPDRPHRAIKFGRLMARIGADRVILVGGTRGITKRAALKAGFPGDRMMMGGNDPARLLDSLIGMAPQGGTAIGLGNFAGMGRRIIEELEREESHGN